MKKIAINGFGRIGRGTLRALLMPENRKEFEVVAINDLSTSEALRYVFQYDSVYGTYPLETKIVTEGGEEYLQIGDDTKILMLTQKDPSQLPWGKLGVDVVVEATGVFNTTPDMQPHIDAGAKKVVLTAPAKDEETLMVTPHLGEEKLASVKISSNASCTTNAIAPLAAVLHEKLGIKKAVMTTIHAYTASQPLVDLPDKKDLRRGRAGAINMAPTTTGAAKAVGKVIPELAKNFDGVAVRVPIVAGSLVDMTFLAGRNTTVEEVNQILQEASEGEWKGILKVSTDPLVSTDILGTTYATIVEPDVTKVVDGDLVKVMSWYDNEMGYVHMLVRHLKSV
jgi:glyceraldehyde 3-phosphate dehydrogenase